MNDIEKGDVDVIKEAISKLVLLKNLTDEEAAKCMDEIMSGKCTPAQISSFITALRIKGETVEEITGCARVMREKATRIKSAGELVDTCGTGGDGAHTFNISTISAFVVAGAGVKVAKHGNRSVSSRCGSADLLAGLGVNLELNPKRIEECIEEVGVGFLFAPALHSSMKYAIGPRREIGIRTIFNILGPLTNPAFAKRQLLGVYDPKLTEPLARVLYNLGSKHVFVVHGFDGLDEVTITNSTRITELKDGKIRTYNVTPEDFGLRRGEMRELRGGDVEDNIRIALDILKGGDGARRDIVLLNAAFAIVASGKVESVMDGIELAKHSIQTGEALKRLELLRDFTTSGS